MLEIWLGFMLMEMCPSGVAGSMQLYVEYLVAWGNFDSTQTSYAKVDCIDRIGVLLIV